MPRTVSLLAAATEIVAAVGAGDELVGVSHECDHPRAVVAGRPVLTSARVGPLPSSAEVDRSVRRLVGDALAVYDVDVELLAALAPDVIVTQDLCRVCAVSVDDVRSAVAQLAHKAEVQLVSLHPRRLDDILDDVERVAAVLGRAGEGRRVVAGLRERIERVRTVAAGAPERKVLAVEWIEPVMLGGLWMPELIELAGAVPLGVAAGARSGAAAGRWAGWLLMARPPWDHASHVWWSRRRRGLTLGAGGGPITVARPCRDCTGFPPPSLRMASRYGPGPAVSMLSKGLQPAQPTMPNRTSRPGPTRTAASANRAASSPKRSGWTSAASSSSESTMRGPERLK